MENKAQALAHLKIILNQCTREEVSDLSIDRHEEFVTITYPNGYEKKVNVHCDSCIAMIRDVLLAFY